MISGGNGKRWWTPERNAIGRTHARLKRAGVGTNGILECKLQPKTRTVPAIIDVQGSLRCHPSMLRHDDLW
jgi:hypothetical protein